MNHIDKQLLAAMFSQSLDGIFFMMLDQPIRWDKGTDKEAILEYVITHQRITSANDAFYAHYRAQPEQILGLTPLDLFAHDPEQCRRVWRDFLDAGHLHSETEERRMDGSLVWVEGDYIWLKNEKDEYIGHFGIQRDISERRRAERELRDAQERYDALFEQEHDAVYLLDLEGRHIAVNQRAVEMMGYTLDELKALSYKITSAEQEASQAVLQRLLNGEKIPLYQRWFIKKNGKRFPAEVNVKLVRDSENNPLYIQSLHRDVSQREGLQMELERRAAHAEALNQVIEAAIGSKTLEPLFNFALEELSKVFKVDGGVIWTASTFVNFNTPPEFEFIQEILKGYPVPNIKKQIVTDWESFCDTNDPMSNFSRKLLALGIRSTLTVPLTKDDTPIGAIGLLSQRPRQWEEEEINLAEAVGRQLGMAAERLHLEKALQISEERYRILAEMTSDYANVYRVSRDGQAVLEWERDNALTQMTGYTRPEIEANGGPGFLVLPEDRENAQPYWPPNNRIQESQFRLRHKNGEIHWVQRITLWDASTEGDVLGRYYETLKDITESKKMEAQAISLSLEQERTRILRNFIRDASHEFRTPLSIIGLNLYPIRKSCQIPEHHLRFDVINKQIQTMSELVDSLLVLSRLDYDTELKISTMNVNNLVAAECEVLQPLAHEKSLDFQIDLDWSLAPIQGALGYLSMSVRHLLQNAIRYTEQGSVRVRTYTENEHIIIEVKDSGIGMPDEIQQRIFERFYRHNEARSDSGFGLGLSIVQKVVEHHRGHITVESNLGSGSTFRIYLPA